MVQNNLMDQVWSTSVSPPEMYADLLACLCFLVLGGCLLRRRQSSGGKARDTIFCLAILSVACAGRFALNALPVGNPLELIALKWVLTGMIGFACIVCLLAIPAVLKRLPAGTCLGDPSCSALEDVHDVVICLDADFRIRGWNKSAELLYGWSSSEVVPQNVARFLPVRAAMESLLPRLRAGEALTFLDVHTKKDQTSVPVSIRCRMRFDQYCLIIEETAHRDAAEQTLLRNQRLENLGNLASGIVHDLNNVLAPILMATELLRNEKLSPHGIKYLHIIQDSTQRGIRMVKHILSFARGGSKGEDARVKDVCTSLRDMITTTFPKTIQFHLGLDPNAGLVKADPTQLYQILLNLSVNARDAMPDGGKLRLDVAPVKITAEDAVLFSMLPKGNYVQFTIRDTGTGIPPEIKAQLFTPFFTTKGGGKGTGLGLASTKKLVEQYGGCLLLETEVGKGTAFKVFLPAAQLSSAETAQAPCVPAGSGETILLVDDEPNILETTKQVLEQHGYKVQIAETSRRALALYAGQTESIALVISDSCVPLLKGLSVVDALYELNPRVRVLNTTGFAAVDAKPLDPIKGQLSKPFTAQQLLDTVHQLLHPPPSQ